MTNYAFVLDTNGKKIASTKVQKTINFQSLTKHCKKVNAKKCKLLWKYNKIYWLESAS